MKNRVSWLGTVAALGVAFLAAGTPPQPPMPQRRSVELGADASFSATTLGPAAILSPDGAVLAFVAQKAAGERPQLYLRRLDQLRATPLSGTEGGRAAYQLRVTYDAGVGSDTWYFFLDRETCALVGHRFHHDESAGDGEYAVLSEETSGQGLRLPRVRKWYTNKDDLPVITHTILSIVAP